MKNRTYSLVRGKSKEAVMNWRPVKTLSNTELRLSDFIGFGPALRLICDHPTLADTYCGHMGYPAPLCIDQKKVTYPKQF